MWTKIGQKIRRRLATLSPKKQTKIVVKNFFNFFSKNVLKRIVFLYNTGGTKSSEKVTLKCVAG